MQTFGVFSVLFCFHAYFCMCCLSVAWWVDGTSGYHKSSLKCQRTSEHLCWVPQSSSQSQYPSRCIEEKSIYVRHGGILNSRHTVLYRRNVSWWFCWLPCVKIAHHPAAREWRMQRKWDKVDSDLFSTLTCERDLPLSTRHSCPPVCVCVCVWGGATTWKRTGNKKMYYQEVSVLSLQSCQYGDKWLFNILYWALKWWEKGWCKSYNCCSVLETDRRQRWIQRHKEEKLFGRQCRGSCLHDCCTLICS